MSMHDVKNVRVEKKNTINLSLLVTLLSQVQSKVQRLLFVTAQEKCFFFIKKMSTLTFQILELKIFLLHLCFLISSLTIQNVYTCVSNVYCYEYIICPCHSRGTVRTNALILMISPAPLFLHTVFAHEPILCAQLYLLQCFNNGPQVTPGVEGHYRTFYPSFLDTFYFK